ncbi:MAG TPA: tetratricopeptide repeat protein [Bacteroidia bacterium]|nr:tetratricopeptide repeat protein [Bacteroidia bacterium]
MRCRIVLLLSLCLFMSAANAQDKNTSAKFFNQAMIKFRQAKNEEAIRLLTSAINADTLNDDAWIKRGFIKSMVGDFEGELQDYNRVIAIHPDHKWAYISRGSAYNKMEKFNEAIGDFNKALEIDPKDAEAYNNRGFAKKGLGNKEGACEDWNTSRKLGNSEASVILKNNNCK